MTPKELASLGLGGLYRRVLHQIIGDRPAKPGGVTDRLREDLIAIVSPPPAMSRTWRSWSIAVTDWASGQPVPPGRLEDTVESLELLALTISQTAAEIRACADLNPGVIVRGPEFYGLRGSIGGNSHQVVPVGVRDRRVFPDPYASPGEHPAELAERAAEALLPPDPTRLIV